MKKTSKAPVNLIITVIILFPVYVHAQLPIYISDSVSSEVKKNAAVVKRFENIEFVVNKPDDATVEFHQVFTVLNEEGKSTLLFNEYTSKYISLDDVEIKLYDAKGKQISRYKKKDLHTQAVGEGLIEDGYVTFFESTTSTYPVTVEYKYKLQYTGTLNIPDYRISRHSEGVEQSQFTARIAESAGLRYRAKNIDLKPEITQEGKYAVYKWKVKNLPPYEYEDGAVSYEERYPSVKMALNRFSIYGYEGDMSSWKNFGAWISSLYKGLDELPQEKKTFFNNLVSSAKNDREKARIIYEYLQKNFRYVSIQLGIGGYKPFSAAFTEQKKYGDCKGLSNYMKAALNAVGVKSHLAIINAGYNDEPVIPEFPSNSFNHVILCIPQLKDSIWLECTSSTSDFAELGTFTENRYAMLITENGGVLVPTPSSNPNSNKLITKTIIEMADDGSGESRTEFRTSGYFRVLMDDVLKAKKDDQKETLVFGLYYKQPDEFEFNKVEKAGIHTTTLAMVVEKIPEFTAGSKVFLSPRLYKLWPRKLPKAENRRLDFYFRQPFIETDTTIYKLPDGFVVDVMPATKELTSEYSHYISKTWYDENQKALINTVTLELKKHKIPAAKYAEVKKFFDDVMMNENQRIVIKKN